MKVSLRWLSRLAVLGGLAWYSPSARAQCLPLRLLTAGLAQGQAPTIQTVSASLPASEWQMHKTDTGAAYWSFTGETANADAPETQLELRRPAQQTQFDLVYKTSRRGCFTDMLGDLRADLQRAQVKAEAVTCIQCEAGRYTAPTYTVTIFDQQENFSRGKSPYPYVIVVHPLIGGAPAPAAGPAQPTKTADLTD